MTRELGQPGMPWYAESLARRRPSRWRNAILIVGLVALASGTAGTTGFLLIPAAVLWLLADRARRAGPHGSVEAWLEDAALHLAPVNRADPAGAAIELPLRTLRDARVLGAPGGAGVVVLRTWLGERQRLRFVDVVEARRFVDRLGFGPRRRPMTFRFFFGLRVTVGIDGVVVAVPLLARRRFVRHDAITEIRQTSTQIVLVLRSGVTYDIATGGGEEHEALFERLLDATEVRQEAEHAEPLAMLQRAGRAIAAWVKDLRALGSQAPAGYRAASLPEDTLWRLALDPTEKPELRIGATLALRAVLDAPGRARLRVAAEAAASPRVRVALEAAADDASDEAVAEVLARRA